MCAHLLLIILKDLDINRFWDLKYIWKDVVYTLFKAEIFTIAAKLKELVGARVQQLVTIANNVFPLSIWDLGATEDLYYARCAVWCIFFQVPIYFSCLR